jgi:hypothetical protein
MAVGNDGAALAQVSTVWVGNIPEHFATEQAREPRAPRTLAAAGGGVIHRPPTGYPHDLLELRRRPPRHRPEEGLPRQVLVPLQPRRSCTLAAAGSRVKRRGRCGGAGAC